MANLASEIVCGLLTGVVIWLAVLFVVLIVEALRKAGKEENEND